MKATIALTATLLLCSGAFAQEFSISQFDGVLISYDYSYQTASKTSTEKGFKQFYHEAYIAAIGPIDVFNGGSYTGTSYGALGVVLGTANNPFDLPLIPGTNLYSPEGERITSLRNKPLGIIGGRIRFMGPTKARTPLLASYAFLDLEYLSYRFKAQAQKGAFGHYTYEEEDLNLQTINLLLGVKAAIVKISGGIGYGFSLYREGKQYDNPNRYSSSLKGQPKATDHFTIHVGIGIALDLIKH